MLDCLWQSISQRLGVSVLVRRWLKEGTTLQLNTEPGNADSPEQTGRRGRNSYHANVAHQHEEASTKVTANTNKNISRCRGGGPSIRESHGRIKFWRHKSPSMILPLGIPVGLTT